LPAAKIGPLRPTLRIGIVGCGKIADAHIEQIRATGIAEVVAACDSEPLMARQLAARYNVPATYGGLDAMLDKEQIHVVHITTPPGSHPDLAARAFRAGCHVFLEKPVALNADGTEAIIAAAEAAQRKLSVNYWYNFEPPAVALQQLIAEGTLGEPVHVESTFGYDLSGIFGSAVLGNRSHWVHGLPGKLFHNVLDHLINKITPFMPDASPEIIAMDYRLRPASGDRKLDAIMDELRFFMRGERVSASGLVSSHARPIGHSVRVYGTQNTVYVDFLRRTIVVDSAQKVPSALGRLLWAYSKARSYRRCVYDNFKQFLRAEFHTFEGMRRLLRSFYASIHDDTPVPIQYAEILRISRLIDTVLVGLQQTRIGAEVED
jgi:predicted dehydrogenase